MEDRHTILANYEPTGAAAAAADAGVLRSFAGVYDGHNGSQTAEEAAARYILLALPKAGPLLTIRGSGQGKCSQPEDGAEHNTLILRSHRLHGRVHVDPPVVLTYHDR